MSTSLLSIALELRRTVRRLLRHPGFTAAAVLTLLAIRNDVTIPADLDGVRHLLDRVTPAREAWYALPLVAAAYVVLGLVLVPVLLLIAATGLLFLSRHRFLADASDCVEPLDHVAEDDPRAIVARCIIGGDPEPVGT